MRSATSVTCRASLEKCTIAASLAGTVAIRHARSKKVVNGIDLNYGKAVRGKNSTVSHWDC